MATLALGPWPKVLVTLWKATSSGKAAERGLVAADVSAVPFMNSSVPFTYRRAGCQSENKLAKQRLALHVLECIWLTYAFGISATTRGWTWTLRPAFIFCWAATPRAKLISWRQFI